MSDFAATDLRLRAAEPPDADEVARIVYEAFAGIHDRHAFPRDFFPAAHAVADSYEAMQALIAGAISDDGPPASFLLPTRQPGLLRWALDAGLRVVKPMNYMVIGRHAQPLGAWIPSVSY